MIGGEALRGALRLAALLVLLSAVTTLFQERSSAGFVVAVMALVVSLLFLLAVLAASRIGRTRLPPARDSDTANRYNTEREPSGAHRRGP